MEDAQGIGCNSVAEGAEKIFSGMERCGKIFSRISLSLDTNGVKRELKGWGLTRCSIKRIKVEGFKSIKDIDLDIKQSKFASRSKWGGKIELLVSI